MSPSDENPMTIATRNPLTEIFDRLGEKLPLCAAFSNKQAICGRPPRYAPPNKILRLYSSQVTSQRTLGG